MREVIKAGEGKILTDGEIYGKVIFLADGRKKGDFYEIDEAEYKKIMEEENDKNSLLC